MWRTVRPPHAEHAAAAPGSQCAGARAPSLVRIQPPTEAHPPPHLPRPDLEQAVRGGAPGAQAAQWARPCARGADLRHRSASQHLAFWPFDGHRGPSRAAPLGHRAPRTPLVRLGLARGCPWHGPSVLLLRVGLLPGAETAAAGQAGSRLLGPAQGACSPPPMPAHAAHAAPHAHRPTQAQAPRPAHARRSRRCSRPLRVPCSHWQMGAQGRRASRRAPAGGARSCCNGRLWPVKRCLGGCMPSPPAPSLHRRLRCGRS